MKLTTFHVMVEPNEIVVEHVDGKPTLLTPGRHSRKRRASYSPVFVGTRLLQLAPQEIPTADGAQIKVTAVAQVRAVDAARTLEFEQPDQPVYLAIQIALRDEFADLTLEEAAKVTRNNPELIGRVQARAVAAGKEIGYEVASVVIKDVILPGELRAAALELLTAKTRGLAQLEVARAETAALRALANGAKILEEHPPLAKLRMVQAIPMGSSLSLQVDDKS